VEVLKNGVRELALCLACRWIRYTISVEDGFHGVHMHLLALSDVREYRKVPPGPKREIDIPGEFLLFPHIGHPVLLIVGQWGSLPSSGQHRRRTPKQPAKQSPVALFLLPQGEEPVLFLREGLHLFFKLHPDLRIAV